MLTLTDGGAGDADGVANGQIVDPGSPGSTVSAPDVVGLSQANADTAIVGAGLVLGTVTTANSNTMPIGDVISQNPSAGTDVAPGSTVDIEVSLGASVPDVVGLREASAGAAIVGAGMVLGTVTPANSNTVPTGDVISQAPDAGANVAPGTAVTIQVSSAGASVPVPDVAGLSQANAEAAIVGAGLVVGSVITANSNTVPTGDVISQAPGAGTGVAPGSAVIIVVSLGGASVPVPDVTGLSQANADAAIVGAGLVVGTVTTANSSTVSTGDVISQSPSAGSNVAPGSAVAIEVSLGASVAQVTASGSNGLFGCSVGSGNGPADPTLPLLVLISVLYLTRRRWMRAWQALIRRLARDKNFGAATLAAPLLSAALIVLIHLFNNTGSSGCLQDRKFVCGTFSRPTA